MKTCVAENVHFEILMSLPTPDKSILNVILIVKGMIKKI